MAIANINTSDFLKEGSNITLSVVDGVITINASGSLGGPFTSLTDVPTSYTGQGLKIVRVNAGETGLEFATSSGGGTTVNTGTTNVDFGTGAGTNYVTTTVTGQTGILTSSYIQCYLMAQDSTADHNAYEHSIVPMIVRAGNIVAGTGFDIIAVCDWRLTGQFKIRWQWI